MKRDAGYYWVKFLHFSGWRVAQWNGTDWLYCGIEGDMPDPDVIGVKVEQPV